MSDIFSNFVVGIKHRDYLISEGIGLENVAYLQYSQGKYQMEFVYLGNRIFFVESKYVCQPVRRNNTTYIILPLTDGGLNRIKKNSSN